MLKDIETTVAARLQEKILEPKNVDIDERHAAQLKLPGIEVLCGGGKFERTASTSYKLVTSVFVIVTFANLQSAKERRHGIYPILIAIVVCLMLQDLGLEITPLVPTRLDNVTDEDEAKKGLIVFQLEFETSFTLKAVSDEEVGDLLKIGLNYYLDPDDDVKDAEDVITLREP